MKRLTYIFVNITIFLAYAGQKLYAQNDTTKIKITSAAYVYYAFSGLGSNMGHLEPKVIITGTKLTYTYAQNSYYGQRTEEEKPISSAVLRESSIDSILDLVKNLKDTLIFKSNPCIMSGGIHFITIANGKDSTHFELGNTFDYTALKIVDIINEYLPSNKRLWPTEKLIKDETECWKWLFKDINKRQNKPTKFPQKNGT